MKNMLQIIAALKRAAQEQSRIWTLRSTRIVRRKVSVDEVQMRS